MREENIDDRRMIKFGRNHQCGAAAIIRGIDIGLAIQQKLHDIFGVEYASTVGVTRSPHLDGEFVAIPSVD